MTIVRKWIYVFGFLLISVDITKVHEEWMDAISRTSPTATELKLKRRWKPPFNDGDPSSGEENAWILSTYAPGFDSGEITDVTGCITGKLGLQPYV